MAYDRKVLHLQAPIKIRLHRRRAAGGLPALAAERLASR